MTDHESEHHEYAHKDEPGRPIVRGPEAEEAAVEPGEPVRSSKGLGAVWGDAERTPHPGPVKPPGPDDAARMRAVAEEYEVVTEEDGERYLTPREGETEAPATTDEYPDS